MGLSSIRPIPDAESVREVLRRLGGETWISSTGQFLGGEGERMIKDVLWWAGLLVVLAIGIMVTDGFMEVQ